MVNQARRLFIAVCLVVSAALIGCKGELNVDIRVPVPGAQRVHDLTHGIIHDDPSKIRAALAATVVYEEVGPGGHYLRKTYSGSEFAAELPRLYGQGNVVSISFAERTYQLVNNELTLVGSLIWTVVDNDRYDHHTTRGTLSITLKRLGDDWYVGGWKLVRHDKW